MTDKPEKAETTEPVAAEKRLPAAPVFVEHVKIGWDDIARRGMEKDSRFLTLYWSMQKEFGDRSYGRKVCLHEAAHAELMEQDGIQNVRFAGPAINYDAASKRFNARSAVAMGDDQPNAIADDDFIFKIVCHMAAGGVSLRLKNIAEAGDDEDFEDFKRRCSAHPPKSGENPEALWKRA